MANKVYVYDVETLPNYFSVIFIDYWEYHKVRSSLSKDKELIVSEEEKIKAIESVPHVLFEISDVVNYEVNDVLKLIDFINDNDYLCGFNSYAYDDNILKFIMINLYKFRNVKDMCRKINEFSQLIIETERSVLYNLPEFKNVVYYKPKFKTIDLQKIPALDKVYKSLKQTLINIQWHKIKDYSMPPICDKDIHYYDPTQPLDLLNTWDRFMISDYIDDMQEYNLNDVRGTCELFFVLFDQIKLRFDINNKFNIYTLYASDSNIADRFIFKYYCEAAGIDYSDIRDLRTYRTRMSIDKMISPVIKFKTNKFQHLLTSIKSMVVSTTADINILFEHDNTEYSIKSGGLHSKDKPGVFKATNDIIYRDADVN